MNNQEHFSHLLQKKGLLKNFSIAKIVPTKDIDALRESIKQSTTSEAEFKLLFNEAMKKIGNMHSLESPIPGIIYGHGDNTPKLSKLVIEQVKRLKAHNFTKLELCFYIASLVKSMGLTQEDFEAADADSPMNQDDEDDDRPYRDSDSEPGRPDTF
jgi:hypothetical protein